MTIAITVKVNDGIVLAADSAATLSGPNGQIMYVFNNANKITNLLKGARLGFISWGAGGIGNAGLETLMKDLRRRFSGSDPDHADWKLDRDNFSVADAATRVREFLFDEVYAQVFPAGVPRPELGCIVAGYSSGQSLAEQYEIKILRDGTCPDPREVCPRDYAPMIAWGGQTQAIERLLHGFDPALPEILRDKVGVASDRIEQATQDILAALARPVIAAPMPIKDAIELAEFLVDLTSRFTHFTPGASTVGGPIELAAITNHEGFKWIQRKYYYQRELNPEEARDA